MIMSIVSAPANEHHPLESPNQPLLESQASPLPDQGSAPIVTSGKRVIPVLDKAHRLACAREFRDRTHRYETLRHHNGIWYALFRPHTAYVELEAASVRAALYTFLENSIVQVGSGDDKRYEPFKPDMADVNAVLDALRAVSHLPAMYHPPCWLPYSTHRGVSDWDAYDVIAVSNGLLHLPTRHLIPATPDFFTTNELPFRFDPAAPPPTRWLRFLASVWPDDMASRDLLQEVFGYLVSGDTLQQKLFLLTGPPRSGKGTIAQVLRGLIGFPNTCAPSLSNLSETFGLQQFIDKSLAIVPDGRLGSRSDMAQLLERLLSISGGDVVSIQRKYLSDWTGVLHANVVIISNELPKIRDVSGALASRFVPVVFSRSFLGREDPTLIADLVTEWPSLLNWALDGRDRLAARGRFALSAAYSTPSTRLPSCPVLSRGSFRIAVTSSRAPRNHRTKCSLRGRAGVAHTVAGPAQVNRSRAIFERSYPDSRSSGRASEDGRSVIGEGFDCFLRQPRRIQGRPPPGR